MNTTYNPFINNFAQTGVRTFTSISAFPASSSVGDLGVAQDSGILYEWNGSSWVAIGGPGEVLSVGTFDSGSPSANGAHIDSDKLIMQSASTSNPGLINTTTQSLSGNKTFTGSISASNLSGSNTGDQTITLTGDVTGSGTGSFAASLVATTNGTLTTLSALTTASSLASIGTITTGIWNAGAITSSGNIVSDNVLIEVTNNSNSGVELLAQNTGTGAGTDAHVRLQVQQSGGDPHIWWSTQGLGNASWAMGTHTATDNSMRLSNSSQPGTSDMLVINSTTGNATFTGTVASGPISTSSSAALQANFSSTNTNGVYIQVTNDGAGTIGQIGSAKELLGGSLSDFAVTTAGNPTNLIFGTGVPDLATLTLNSSNQAIFLSTVQATQYTSTISTGTAPFVVSSTTSVANLTSGGNLLKITGDIDPTSFSAANNISSPADVTGLAFANANVRAAKIILSVFVNATSSLYEAFEMVAIQRGADWQMSQTSVGDTSGFVFTITTAGQVQYVNSNYTGFSAATVKFRALALPV